MGLARCQCPGDQTWLSSSEPDARGRLHHEFTIVALVGPWHVLGASARTSIWGSARNVGDWWIERWERVAVGPGRYQTENQRPGRATHTETVPQSAKANRCLISHIGSRAQMEDEPRAAQAPQPQENGVGEGDRPRASRLAAGHDSHNAQPAQGASEGIPEAAAHASAPAGAHVTGAHATAPTDSPAVTSGPSLDADTAPQSPDGLAPQGHGHAQQDASPAPTPPRPTSSSSTAPTGTGPGAGTGSAAAAAPPAVTAAGFVAPHSYLRPVGGPQRPPLSRHNTSSAMQRQRDNQVEIDQTEGLVSWSSRLACCRALSEP